VPPLAQLHPTAFVTGASGGLGRAFAEMLLDEGVRVWGTAREVARLSSLGRREGFSPVALDLADRAGAVRAWNAAHAQAGGFSLLVNNAGYGHFGAFAEQPFETWQAQLEAMLGSTLALTQAAMRDLLAQGHGAIVNVSSLAVEFPLPYMSGYNIAKAGLSAFSESLMIETAGTGLTVIDFRPGDYRTGFNQAMSVPSSAASPVRLARAWQTLEANLLAAPPPARAAADLRRALADARSGVVRSGSFFQARLAPFLARLAPLAWRRAVAARYFGVA
jgi:short-subunit dehydrogenase